MVDLDSRFDSVIKWKQEAVFDENTGTWTEGGGEKETICRASPSSSGSKVFHDGAHLEYAFNIAFPFNSVEIPEGGQQISIYSTDDKLIFKGLLLRVHRGMWSIRAWA